MLGRPHRDHSEAACCFWISLSMSSEIFLSHHLGNTLYRYASTERQGSERVARHMERDSLPDATGFTHGAQFVIHHTTAATAWKDKVVTFLFHRLFLSASAKDLLRDRM